MKNGELNAYIYNYYKNDLADGALMITGPEGNGKSHYIRNSLIPYLNGTEEHIGAVLVNLFGLESIEEVSRNVFLENQFKLANAKPEKFALGAVVAKSVLKGLLAHYQVNLEPDTEDKDVLYKSVNLTGKILIFENVDQTKVDPVELYSYVGNLTKQDDVKVLLVANETEDADEPEQLKLIRKRVISDTVRFEPDIPLVIRDVFREYEDPSMDKYSMEEDIREIEQCFQDHGCFSLRALLNAFQKTDDLYRYMDTEKTRYDPDFLKTIFMGILNYYLRVRAGKPAEWEDEYQLSFRLGSARYPLFRFCYQYISAQIYQPSQVMKAQESLRKIRAYDSSRSIDDPDLSKLYTWYYQKEQDLADTVARISERLRDPAAFPLQEYGEIARYLIQAKRLLHCDISSAKKLLASNLKAQGMKLNADFITRSPVPEGDDPEDAAEFMELRKKMLDALKQVDMELLGFSYHPAEIDAFARKVVEDRGRILEFGAFARAMNNDKIRSMLKQCSAREIYDFRKAYLSVYRIPDSFACLSEDRESIDELSMLLKELESYEGYDRIQRKNLQDFIRDLDRIELNL